MHERRYGRATAPKSSAFRHKRYFAWILTFKAVHAPGHQSVSVQQASSEFPWQAAAILQFFTAKSPLVNAIVDRSEPCAGLEHALCSFRGFGGAVQCSSTGNPRKILDSLNVCFPKTSLEVTWRPSKAFVSVLEQRTVFSGRFLQFRTGSCAFPKTS